VRDRDAPDYMLDQLELSSEVGYLNSMQMALNLQATWNLSLEVWHSWVDV